MTISYRSLSTWIFFFAYTTFLTFSSLGHIPILGGYLKLATNVGIVLLVLLFIIRVKIYSAREGLIFAILFAFSFIMIARTDYYGLFKLVLMIAATKEIDFKKCIKFDLILRIVLIAILYALFNMGIAPDVTSVFNGTVRHSMGFQNSNHVGLAAFIIILEILYLGNMKFKILRYLVIIAILVLSDITAGSRTAELFTIIALILAAVYYYFPNIFHRKGVKFVVKWSAVFFSIITAVLSRLYNSGNAIAIVLNELFSNRISNVAFFNNMFDTTLFGNDISSGNRTLDSVYAYLWICLGLVAFIFFILAYTKLIGALYKKDNIPMVIIMFCFAMYGLSERLWMNIDYNIFMMVFRELIYHDMYLDDFEYDDKDGSFSARIAVPARRGLVVRHEGRII